MSDTVTTKSADGSAVAEPSASSDIIGPVAGYFGIGDPDPVQQMKLETISRLLQKEGQEYNEIDMVRDLRNYMFKLGTPPLGGSVLDHAYHFAKIQNQIKGLESEREKFLK